MGNSLLYQYKKQVSRYQCIEAEGLLLYPITVEHYEEFLVAEKALGFLNQSLKPEYMSMPLLQAFFKIDFDMAVRKEEATGLFASALAGIALALRLTDSESLENAIQKFELHMNPNDVYSLHHISFTDENGDEKTITPIQYARLRPLIAMQNGVKIESEDANIELLQAEKDLAEKRSLNLEYDIDNLITAASALTREDKASIYDWPILKLHDTLNAYKRVFDYIICGVGESQGTTWKGGNPCPHPWFDRKKEGSSALIKMENFAGGQGYKAMADAGAFDEEISMAKK